MIFGWNVVSGKKWQGFAPNTSGWIQHLLLQILKDARSAIKEQISLHDVLDLSGNSRSDRKPLLKLKHAIFFKNQHLVDVTKTNTH